jgi:hypothetical protein
MVDDPGRTEPTVVRCLSAVAVRIEQERTAVARRVLRPLAWRAVIAVSGFDPGAPKPIHMLVGRRRESDVKPESHRLVMPRR